jgi:hypothetical protein
MLALAGCGTDGQDPRISLCKHLTADLAGRSVDAAWEEPAVTYRRPEFAAVTVATAGEPSDQGTCYYAYEITEETAMDHANPLLAYSTLPYEMTLNGQPVPADVLEQAVKKQQMAAWPQ